MGRFLIHIDAQDAQDFFRRRLACVPGHPQIRTRSLPESASRAAASRPDYPVHPVHRCSIYSPSRWICPVAGGRAPGSQANGSFPKGTGRLSEKSPAGYPPPHHRDDTPRERGRPARMLSLRLPLSFPAMLQPTALPAGTAWARPKQRQGRRCRLIPVEEMAEAAGGFVRAGRPRSRVGFLP